MHRLRRLTCGIVLSLTPAAWGGDCVTIHEAHQAVDNTAVTLCNVVVSSTTDLVDAAGAANFYVQDATGGLDVWGPTSVIAALLEQTAEGHVIDLSGRTGSYNGMFQLTMPFQLVDHGFSGIPTPVQTTVADWQDDSPTAEALEGMLVGLGGVRFLQTGVFHALTAYSVSADGGQTRAQVWISTHQQNIRGTPIPTGCVNLRGIFTQWDLDAPYTGGYEFRPRDLWDITPCLPGDLDFDCAVDLTDLTRLLANFGTQTGAIPRMGDVDGDHDVDLTDLTRLLTNFGTTCP